MLEKATLAARIAKAIEDSAYSQEGIAREIGVTEQAVSGWVRTGKIGKDKLPRLAKLTGKPLSYFLVDGHSAAADAASQVQRPDPEILVEALDFLERAYANSEKEFDIRREAALFADVYAWIADDPMPMSARNLIDFAEWKARRSTGGTTDAGQDRGIAGEAPRANRRRASS